MAGSASEYSEQFPWDKFDAAKRYLYLVKPWWARFGEKLKVVPVYQRPPEGKPYGSITSTDGGFRLYVDVSFAAWAPLHMLAGAIEHEFQHHTRNSWGRLNWLSLDEWRQWANIVLDLEINGGIDHESRQLDMEKIRALAAKSNVFVDYELDFWSVTEPPNLGEEGWLPRLMGLPDRLSAEEYLNILQMALKEPPPPPEQAKEPENSEENDDQESEGEPQERQQDDGESPDDQDDSESNSDSESENDQSDEDTDEDDSDADSDEDESDQSDEESDESESEDDGEGSGSEEDDSDESDDGEDSDGDDSDDEPSDDSDDGEGQGDGEGSDSEGNGTSDSDGEPQSEEGKPSEGSSISSSKPKSLAEVFADLKSTGDRRLWSAEMGNPQDELIQPAWKPEDRKNEKPIDRASIESAYIELEEDIREYGHEAMGAAGFGLAPGNDLLQWVSTRRRVRGVDWQSRLNKLLSSSYTSAKVHGASDLSYTVRNPNQPEFGVILQGLHDYAPTIVVIQDVSGSMLTNNRLNKSMSTFTDLCSKILGRFNSPVTWVTVDAGIIDVGSASSWTKQQHRRWSQGFGGTDIAPALEQVMTGKMYWKGKKYPKADLTVITTDCAFKWPERRPIRNGKLLVVSVESDMKVLNAFLPKWLDRKRELVIIDD